MYIPGPAADAPGLTAAVTTAADAPGLTAAVTTASSTPSPSYLLFSVTVLETAAIQIRINLNLQYMIYSLINLLNMNLLNYIRHCY